MRRTQEAPTRLRVALDQMAGEVHEQRAGVVVLTLEDEWASSGEGDGTVARSTRVSTLVQQSIREKKWTVWETMAGGEWWGWRRVECRKSQNVGGVSRLDNGARLALIHTVFRLISSDRFGDSATPPRPDGWA